MLQTHNVEYVDLAIEEWLAFLIEKSTENTFSCWDTKALRWWIKNGARSVVLSLVQTNLARFSKLNSSPIRTELILVIEFCSTVNMNFIRLELRDSAFFEWNSKSDKAPMCGFGIGQVPNRYISKLNLFRNCLFGFGHNPIVETNPGSRHIPTSFKIFFSLHNGDYANSRGFEWSQSDTAFKWEFAITLNALQLMYAMRVKY